MGTECPAQIDQWHFQDKTIMRLSNLVQSKAWNLTFENQIVAIAEINF